MDRLAREPVSLLANLDGEPRKVRNSAGAQIGRTRAPVSGVVAASHRNNPLHFSEMERQQTNYYGARPPMNYNLQQAYIPMGRPMNQSYAPGPMPKALNTQVYVPTTTQAVQYDGRQPVYYVGSEPPPAENQDCLALRQCWATVPPMYRWPFIIAVAILVLLLLGFMIAFFVTSSGGHFDY